MTGAPQPRRRREDNPNSTAAALAALAARLDEMSGTLSEAKTDAREARDLGNRIATILEEQNITGRLTEMRAEMRADAAELRRDTNIKVEGLRTDMSKVVTDLKKEFADVTGRIGGLETARSKVIGVADFFGWLARVAPWIFAVVAGYFAGIKNHGG